MRRNAIQFIHLSYVYNTQNQKTGFSKIHPKPQSKDQKNAVRQKICGYLFVDYWPVVIIALYLQIYHVCLAYQELILHVDVILVMRELLHVVSVVGSDWR